VTMTNAVLLSHGQDGQVREDDRPRRRTFTAQYKLGILEEYEGLTDPGAKGALLRRQGLYSSHIVKWRRARDYGALRELAPRSRRRRNQAQVELDRAQRKIERLEGELAKHRLALEIQGKASELLGRLLAKSTGEQRQQP
jgi:transposase